MADARTPQVEEGARKRRFFWPGGLSARLLTLTIVFVATGGAFALPIALASYEETWLLDRVRAAELASMAPDAAPDRKVSQQIAQQLEQGAGVSHVAIRAEGVQRLVLGGPVLKETPYVVDLRSQAPVSWLVAPFQTLFGGEWRSVRVIASPRFRHAELKKAMWGYLLRLVMLVAFVSSITGVLVYFTLNLFLVRPMQRITRAMERFRADPEDPDARVAPSGRRDEIGRAEVELDRMQADLRAALLSRARLAALG